MAVGQSCASLSQDHGHDVVFLGPVRRLSGCEHTGSWYSHIDNVYHKARLAGTETLARREMADLLSDGSWLTWRKGAPTRITPLTFPLHCPILDTERHDGKLSESNEPIVFQPHCVMIPLKSPLLTSEPKMCFSASSGQKSGGKRPIVECPGQNMAGS